MKTYIVTLQLNAKEELYTDLITLLKTATNWAHPFPGVWVIQTPSQSAQIRDVIIPKLNQQDGIMVFELAGNKDWATKNVSPAVNEWLKINL